MDRRGLRYFALLVGTVLLIAPGTAAAQTSCSADQPRLAPAFTELASQLGSRVGDATDCEHADATNGDLQQSTTEGLLYLRGSTNTPTFTDGGEHWALRGGQLLDWTTADVDPPVSAQPVVVSTAIRAPSPTLAAPEPPRSVAPTSESGVPNVTGLAVSASAVVILLALAAVAGLAFLRRRPRSTGWVVPPGTQLAISTDPVSTLQTPINDIGNGRATAEAQDILSRDPDHTVVQVRPVALALLMSVILKWLLVIVVGLAITAAFGHAELVLVIVAIALLAILRAYAPLSGTEYRVTSQRIEITSGVFSRQTETRESYEFGNARIRQPLHYRLFGAGDLALDDRQGRTLVLRAIRHPDVVRDVIRGSGQFEAARFEKAHWR